LRAPFDGVLVERRVEIGTLVSPGVPAFAVADLQQVKVRFSVPDTALDLFRTERLLPVSVDAYPNEHFEGRVLSVAPAADPKSRSFEIIVAIDNPTLMLRSGMIASIEVKNDATDHHQVRIPIDALVHDPTRDRYVVYTVVPKDGDTATVKALEVRPGTLANGLSRRERTCFGPAMS
jgi:membrane fusion protein (multidrug efflux system)